MKKPLLSEMTLAEKCGQMLLAYQGLVNLKDYKERRSPEEWKAVIEDEKFGSFWAQTGLGNRGITMAETSYGNRNEYASEFGAFLQSQSDCYKIPALMGLDAEREGMGHLFDELTVACSPNAQGAANDEQLSFELGAAVARELRSAGCNWRWAPCVDVGNRYSMTITRTHAPDDTEREIRLALAQIQGTQSEGVAATAKHFPGGDRYESRDSHFCSAYNSSTMEEWWAEQGKIFQAMIDGGVYSIMVEHLGFPAVDDSKIGGRYRPATISKKIITDLLKNEMGFQGVVITDGIVMASLFTLMPYPDLIVELVNAGNDVLLGIPELHTREIIEQAVLDGRIPESRVDDACQRVLDMKEKLGMFEDGYRLVSQKAEEVAPVTCEVNRKIAEKAIHLVRDRNHQFPLDAKTIKNVTIVCSSHADKFFTDLEVLKADLESRGMQVCLQRRVKNATEMKEIAESSDLILFAVYIGPHEPVGGMCLFGEECNTYWWAFTEGKEKSIGVSMGYPYVHYDLMENADMFVNTYGQSPELMKAFTKAIFGEIPFQGTAPMQLEPTPRTW